MSGKMVFLKQGSIAKRLPTFYLGTIYIKQSQRKNWALCLQTSNVSNNILLREEWSISSTSVTITHEAQIYYFFITFNVLTIKTF